MPGKNTIIVIGLVVILLVLGGWYYMKLKSQSSVKSPDNVTATTAPVSSPVTESASPESSIQENTVSITKQGFSPKEIKIKLGDTVTWVNNDSVDHQVNSAPHPTHTAYPPLNTVGLLKPGDKKSLTFPTKGTYKYHDHLNPSLFGSVVVE